MPESYNYDLVILGSGSTAFAAALRARELGRTAVMIESRTLGGTCVNRGCLPSKNLIEAAKIVYEARNPRFPGLRPVGDALEIDFATLVAQKDEVIQAYRQKKYDGLLGGGVSVIEGAARFVGHDAVEVNGRRITGERFLIATGSRPTIPDIPGLADVPFLTSDLLSHGEEVELTELPASIIIIGGGYIALELGQMFSRFGSRVTILERSRQLLGQGYEPTLGRAVERILLAEGIEVITRAAVSSVRSEGEEVVVSLRVGEEDRERRAARLLVAAGRRPNSDEIGLASAGVGVNDRGEVEVDPHLRTRVSTIFAAGDVVGALQGSQMATPVGSRQGGIAAHNALNAGDPRRFDGRVIPRAIFIDPQVGMVGATEAEAIAAGHRCWCTTLPMEIVPRAGAIRDPRGFIKMIADADTNEVLGVTMLGASAAEVIHEAAMAMHFRAKLSHFVDLIHVYPSMAEAMKLIAIARTKDPWQLSCCAD
ncbi:MAG: mercury(II) reductase [Geminicoccaceae bacterium]